MTTILVVEDSQAQREIIKQLLKEIATEIFFAFDGIEALQLVESTRPDVVVLDIVMPRMNGYEVCRRLKSNDKTHNIPVVMYSTKSYECDFYWGVKLGADAYVSKLDHPQVLVKTIEQLFQKTVGKRQVSRARINKQEAELIAQIKLLYANLRTYKKALANPPAWMDRINLGSYIEQIEAELDELEAQLDAQSTAN
jgi:twitching motility two-component system response regulator PilH